MNILKIKDPQGNWVDIPALKGDKGDKGDPGISPTIDSTLSQANQAADAKAVGDKIDEITLTIDETLTQSGQVADAKVTGDALNAKADQNGYYENLNVGVADQLASKNYIEDNEAYTFRPTGGGAKVGTREFDTIVGGSIVWNQLIQNGNFTDISTWSIVGTGTTYTVENNIATINHAAATSFIYQSIPCIENHKYFITVDVRSDVATNALLYWDGGSFAKQYVIGSDWKTIACLYNGTGTGIKLSIRPNAGEGNTSQLKNFMLLDLTQMFGSEIADYIYNLEQTTPGAGVAWFRKYFPNEYYEYNASELMHVNGIQSHDTAGFNLFDASQYLNLATNYDYIINNYKIKKIRLLPNTTYYVSSNSGKAETSPIILINSNSTVNASNYFDLRKASNAKLFTTGDDGLLYIGSYTNEDIAKRLLESSICINLSGTRNGEYEPYTKHSYPLDSSLTLRGIPKLTDGHLSFDGDIYKPDGTVERRYGIVDLGMLNWSYNSSVACFYVKLGSSQTKYSYSGICYADYKYTISPASSDKIWSNTGYMGAGWNLFFKDSAYTDAASFKAAMSGVYLVYELETPTTEQAQPYQSPQIIDPYGTEEYVTTSLIPVGHQTQYPEDLRAKIESLPWDFANLIAPVETTYIATQNYTTGSLFIVDNILYKATANIANGGTITPNTNCITTTLAEIIAAL